MRKNIFKITLIIFVCYGFASSTFSQENPKVETIETYKTGIFHVGQAVREGNNSDIKWLGSAFLVDDKCTFATAKHIFKRANKGKIVIRFQLPGDKAKIKTVPIRILYEDSQSDLAFLKIDMWNNQPCKSQKSYSFNIPIEYVKGSLTGETVLIIGHPTLFKKDNIDIPVVRKGIISSTEISWVNQPMILLDLFGVPGFSGSPVILDKTGEVIGVIYGPGPTRRNFGFEWATPITQKDYQSAIGTSTTNEETNGD